MLARRRQHAARLRAMRDLDLGDPEVETTGLEATTPCLQSRIVRSNHQDRNTREVLVSASFR